MKELISFELSKLFKKKSIYIFVFLIAVMAMIKPIMTLKDVKTYYGNMEAFKQEIKKYEGKVNSQQQSELEKKLSVIIDKVIYNEKLTEEEKKLYSIDSDLRYYYYLNPDPKYVINGKEYTLSKLQKVVSREHVDSYEYRNLEKAYEYISKMEKPQYIYHGGWNHIMDSIAVILLVIVIIFGISTLFSDEYRTNMIPIILSSTHGRKKLTQAKIIAAMIYATSIFVFNTLIYFLGGLLIGLDGFNSMINTSSSTAQAPYAMTIIQFYFIALGMSLLGVLVLTLFIALISLLSKNSMITFILGLFVVTSAFGTDLPKILRQISIRKLIIAKGILLHYNSYNIFGKPVLYPIVIISAALVAIPILIYAIRYFGRRQSV